jgi:peptidoglycan/LPS O-acetylase OafA/YrhL
VLLVVAFHAGLPVPGGFVGVDVFFVISGFVITAMIQREHSSTGRFRFGRFCQRRPKIDPFSTVES